MVDDNDDKESSFLRLMNNYCYVLVRKILSTGNFIVLKWIIE